MSNTQALCTSFKAEVMQALHALGTTVTRASTSPDTLKAALYLQGGSLGASTTAYSATGEASGSGYTAGGVTVPNATAPATSGTSAFWTPSGNIVFSAITISSAFDSLLLYNSSQSNRAIAVLTFPPQTISAGTFTYSVPANTATSALIVLN